MAKTYQIPPAMWTEAEELLRGRRVIPVYEFDDVISKLAANVPADATTATGRNRRKNLADWIKAGLTRQGKINYVRIRTVEHIIWLPRAGVVHETVVYDHTDVALVVLALVMIANQD